MFTTTIFLDIKTFRSVDQEIVSGDLIMILLDIFLFKSLK